MSWTKRTCCLKTIWGDSSREYSYWCTVNWSKCHIFYQRGKNMVQFASCRFIFSTWAFDISPWSMKPCYNWRFPVAAIRIFYVESSFWMLFTLMRNIKANVSLVLYIFYILLWLKRDIKICNTTRLSLKLYIQKTSTTKISLVLISNKVRDQCSYLTSFHLPNIF